MTEPFEPRHFGKTARNEQRKLLATTLNTSGLAVLGIGFFTPIFSGVALHGRGFQFFTVWVTMLVLHTAAQRILRNLEE